MQNCIELELSTAQTVNSTHYLRILALVHKATLSVCKSLHKFDKEVILPETKGTVGISAILDRCFDDLFVPYTENDRYVDIERSCLEDRMGVVLQGFMNFLINRAKNPKSKNNPMPSFQNAVGNMLGMETAVKSNQSIASNEPPESYGLPSVSLTLQLLEIHLESLERCKELSKMCDLSKNVLTVFKVLVEKVGDGYLIHALDVVLDNIAQMNGRTEPELHGLEVVRVENQILNVLQLHFQTAIIPLLSQSPTIHRDAVIAKNEFMEVLETKMNSIIKIHVDAIQEWLELILSKQKRTDYKPKDEQTASTPSTTTCAQVCEFLNKIHVKAEIYFDSINLTGFLNEVGSIFHMLLLEHIKKFIFSDVGGLILARDLAKYYEIVQSFRIPALTDKFEMVRELGNIYIVKPENIQQVINGGHLSRLDVTLLTPFLMCRVDWKLFTVKKAEDLLEEKLAANPYFPFQVVRETADLINSPTELVVPQEEGAREFNRKVAIAVDSSDFAAYAVEWAIKNVLQKDDLVVLLSCRSYVTPPGTVYMDVAGYIGQQETFQRSASHTLLRGFAIRLVEAGFVPKGFALCGDVREEVVRKAKDIEVDLLIVGSRGLGTMSRLLVGSVSDHIVHNAHCPVVVVKPTEQGMKEMRAQRENSVMSA
ncbi:Exocyst complex component 5 [Podochytrium sp. JEL0797]|nr:Exocyst complex component 5 [Podochytrium sp. JEL0797]